MARAPRVLSTAAGEFIYDVYSAFVGSADDPLGGGPGSDTLQPPNTASVRQTIRNPTKVADQIRQDT